jgi:hypothetical protein
MNECGLWCDHAWLWGRVFPVVGMGLGLVVAVALHLNDVNSVAKRWSGESVGWSTVWLRAFGAAFVIWFLVAIASPFVLAWAVPDFGMLLLDMYLWDWVSSVVATFVLAVAFFFVAPRMFRKA